METCNKIPLAQHGRRGKRLKLNTTTLRGAAQAHTDSRGTRPTNQAGAAVLRDSFSLKSVYSFCWNGRTAPVRSSKSSDRHYSHTSPLSFSATLDSYLCDKSKILALLKEAGSKSTVVVKRCPLVFVVVFHHLITLNSNLMRGWFKGSTFF